MARRSPSRRPRAGGSPPVVFYGLVALLSALFLAATWATLEEPERPASIALAQPPATPSESPAAPSPTSTPALSPTQTTVPPTSTPAVVVVERRPPTQTPRPTASVAAAPSPTGTPVPATPTSSPVPPTSTPTVTGTNTSTPTVTSTSSPTPPPAPTPIVHVVQPGDTLLALGQRYGIPWQSIAAANGLPEGAFLQIGQKLVIPAPT